jgi:hypothetical protein
MTAFHPLLIFNWDTTAPGACYRFAIRPLASSAAMRLSWNLLARRSLALPRSTEALALSPHRYSKAG